MQGKHHLTLIAALTAAAFATAAGAAETAEKTGEVVVTASRVAQELEDVPMSVSVITSDDIRRSSARTVGELLEDIPGVQIMNDGTQGLKRLSIRGEDAFRTLVMIDGQKISEHKSMSGAPILIDPTEIERIEVIKGPASVLYGSDAIGGAVNIITKKGGDKPFEAEASIGYNGAGRGLSEGATISGSTHGFHYRLNGSYESHGDIRTPYGKQENTNFRAKSGGLYLAYDITDHWTAGLTADTFDSSIHGGVFGMSPDAFSVDVPKWRRDKVGLFAEGKNLSKYLSRVRWDGYWQKNDKEMLNHVSQGMTMDNTADNRVKTLGTSIQMDWQLGARNFLITGYEYSQDKLSADTGVHMVMKQPLGPGMSSDMDYTTDRVNEGKQTVHAVFASMETQLPWDLTANYGVRYTWVDSEMNTATASKNGYTRITMPRRTINREYVNVDDGSAGDTGSSDNSRAVFNAGLIWKGIDNLALRATWSQGFRAAILQERYLATSMGGQGTLYGNPDLKPETSNNFEVGARFNNGPVVIDAAAFYSDAKNYITTEYLADGVNSRYVNADKAKTRGLELAASWKATEHIEPYLSLTWMRRQLEWGDYSTYQSGTPEFWARYGVRTAFAVPGGTLTTDPYARSQNETKSYSRTTGVTTRTAGFTTANFAVGYQFGKQGAYQLSAEVINIFNKGYRYNTSTWEAERHLNLKLTAKF